MNKADYLFRISLKCLIRNEKGEVLVVKENGRDWWDLPGGGMDHGENVKTALAREMKEEVSLTGEFSYHIVHVDEPTHFDSRDIWQIRLVFEVIPENLVFEVGEDGDEVMFSSIDTFKDSDKPAEQRLHACVQGIKSK